MTDDSNTGRVSRRSVLRKGAVTAGVGFVAASGLAGNASAQQSWGYTALDRPEVGDEINLTDRERETSVTCESDQIRAVRFDSNYKAEECEHTYLLNRNIQGPQRLEITSIRPCSDSGPREDLRAIRVKEVEGEVRECGPIVR